MATRLRGRTETERKKKEKQRREFLERVEQRKRDMQIQQGLHEICQMVAAVCPQAAELERKRTQKHSAVRSVPRPSQHTPNPAACIPKEQRGQDGNSAAKSKTPNPMKAAKQTSSAAKKPRTRANTKTAASASGDLDSTKDVGTEAVTAAGKAKNQVTVD
eukprot:3591630-Pyramimonas_sp.AAC.1